MDRPAPGRPRLKTQAMKDSKPSDNIRALRAPRSEIAFRHGPGRRIVRYDDRSLEVEWQLGDRKRVARHDLLMLSPLFMEDSTQPPDVLISVRNALLWVAAATTLYFSDYHAGIPLAAPLLALIGAGQLLATLPKMRPAGPCTVICETSGLEIVDIPHARTDENHRLGFEAGLRRNIEEVHRQWRDEEY